MLNRTNIFVFFTIWMLIAILLNERVFSQDSITKPVAKESLKNDSATNPVHKEVIKNDSSEGTDNSAIKSKVNYVARDSIRFDVSEQKVFLFGDAKVTYEDMEIKAGYIEFDMEHNIVYARGVRDSSGNPVLDSAGRGIGDPVFRQGTESFDAKQMTYNFQTKKGKIKDIVTKEGEGVIHAKDAKKDTGNIYYVKNGKYSTCDLDHPHFYLKTTKLKVLPDDKIICGPAYLVIGDVPTPLMLPFGVFPNKKGRKSGVLIPSYGESANLGYFLTNGGYYFGLSDYFDLALRGDIYSQGSFGIHANTNYKKRYKYEGFLGLNISEIKISEKEFSDYTMTRDFMLRWQHNQDLKANPTFHFSANVNVGSTTYNQYNSYNPADHLTNTLSSNVSMSKSWTGSTLSLSASHSENTITHALDITLPEVAYSVNRIYPFRRKNATGAPNWFEKISITPTLNAKNQINTYDSLLFKTKSLDFQPNADKLFQNGINARVPVSTSFNVGPFIIAPSASFNSIGYLQTIQKHGDARDSALITDTLRGFKAAYDVSYALSINTKLYGMYMFKHGRLKAIRHVLTPNVTFSYRPDYSEPHFGFYDVVTTHPEGVAVTQTYSYFQNGIYGFPPSGKSGLVTFSLGNNLEMKLRPSKNDTSTMDKKIMLIDNFSVLWSYNMAVDHFNWSPITLSGRTQLFKKVDLVMNGIIDPYMYNSILDRDVDYFEYQKDGKIGRLTTAALTVSTSLRSITDKQPVKPTQSAIPLSQAANYDQLNYILLHPDYYVDFKVPWNLSVYYNIVYSKPGLRDTVIQTFTFSGDVNITKKWKVAFHSGFDIVKKDFTYTSFDIYRDLHCWEMKLNWIPFGAYKSYMLTIAVKASALQDLKLMRTRQWYDYN